MVTRHRYFFLLLVILSAVKVYDKGCSRDTAKPTPVVVPAVTAETVSHRPHRQQLQSYRAVAKEAPDPRTPLQLAQAACAPDRCPAIRAPKPLLANTTSSPIQPASWTVPSWNIDTANLLGCASNSNSGTSATCSGGCSGAVCPSGIGPVLSANEIVVHRWGTSSPILPQTTTWHVLSTQPLNYEKIVVTPIMVSSGAGTASNFIIVGTPATVGAAFNAGTITAKSVGSPGQLLTVAGIPGGGARGQLVKKTGNSSLAYIDVLSAGTATMTQPVTGASVTTVTAIPVPAEDNSWTSGDNLQLLVPPLFNLQVPFGAQGDRDLAEGTAPTTWVETITIPDSTGTIGASQFTATTTAEGMTFAACVIQPFVEFNGLTSSFGLNSVGSVVRLPGGVSIINAFMFAGAGNTVAGFQNESRGGGFNGDVILRGLSEIQIGAQTNVSGVYIDSRFALIHGAVVDTGGVGSIWGPGFIDLEPPNSAWHVVLGGGVTFANAMQIDHIQIGAGSTASALVNANTLSGTVQAFTSGISLTTANLDVYSGLQDPLTGCKYAPGAN